MLPVDEYVRLSRWKWLEHVFRKEGVIVRGTPGWQVQGRRGRGRLKETFMRTMRRQAGEECWRIWRSWHRIDGGRMNSLRPSASLRVPQELIAILIVKCHKTFFHQFDKNSASCLVDTMSQLTVAAAAYLVIRNGRKKKVV